MITFVTDDLAVVAILAMHNVFPRETELSDRGKKFFRFDSTDYVREVVESYHRGVLQVSAKQFMLLYRDHVTRLRTSAQPEAIGR